MTVDYFFSRVEWTFQELCGGPFRMTDEWTFYDSNGVNLLG